MSSQGNSQSCRSSSLGLDMGKNWERDGEIVPALGLLCAGSMQFLQALQVESFPVGFFEFFQMLLSLAIPVVLLKIPPSALNSSKRSSFLGPLGSEDPSHLSSAKAGLLTSVALLGMA